ncbi:hypothetical protein JCM14076_29130 [Methylosoma difficile]
MAEINIFEPAILIRVAQLFRKGMSDQEIYEITRGVWKVGENREKAEYAFCIANNVVQEIYKIQKWNPAVTNSYETRIVIKSEWKDRWEFNGQVASETMRN